MIDNEGYVRDPRFPKRRLHRSLMEAYLGRTLEADEHVHHVNGDKLDNRVGNLEVLPKAEHHRLHMVGRNRGEDNPMAKLTDAQVGEIRALLAEGGLSQRVIAKRFGVHQVTISKINCGLRRRPKGVTA